MHSSNLQEIVILLLAAVVIVTVFRRLHLSPVLGYFVAGGAIGPSGLAIIQDVESTRYLAEFGVVFLLFSIGLELTFDRLKAMSTHVFGFGTAQVVISGVIISFIAYFLGTTPRTAVLIGGGLALSSTAIVLQVLEERGERSTQVGRLSIAVLILQDLAVVPLLIMVPVLAQQDVRIFGAIVDSLFKAGLALVIIFFIGRQLLRPLFHAVGSLRSHELFIATTLLIVLGAAWLTSISGLSLALGAFVAGLLVAETEFRPQVESDIQPFKGLLMGLFFMTIGMSIDFSILYDKISIISVFTITLIFGKALIVALLAKAFGFRSGSAIQAGLLLSQGSEFAFVLFTLAASENVLPQEIAQILLVVVSLSMAITPLLAIFGKFFATRIDRKFFTKTEKEFTTKDNIDLSDHIIVAGFGRVGKTVCGILSAESMYNYVVIDTDPKKVNKGRRKGFPVHFGNAERVDVLRSLGIERAKMVVVTVRDKKESKRAVNNIHMVFPDIPIIARAWDRDHADELREVGASVAMAEAFESSLMLGKAILSIIGTPDPEIARILDKFRVEEYPESQHRKLFYDEIGKS